MRTLDEIRKRFAAEKKNDIFGLATTDLRIYLPEEMREGIEPTPLPTEEEVIATIRSYLPFAFGKATGHRGLSAGRSIHHLQNWAWLAGRDDLAAFAADDDNYPYYGLPILKHFARELGEPIPPEAENWVDGKSCGDPNCRDCDG